MDADHRRDPFQGGENAGFFEEALAAPDEIFGMLRRARDDHAAVLTQRQRRGQVFLDRDFPAERRIARVIGDAKPALAEN